MIQRRVHVRIECDGFGDEDVQVHELTGVESISRLFELDVVIVCRRPDSLDAEALLTEKVTLVFEERRQEGDAPVELRRVHGMIAEVRDLLTPEAHAMYRLRVVPRLWLAGLVETLDVLLDMSVPDVIRAKLSALNLVENRDYKLFLVDRYPERDIIVQYKESDLAFLSRLTEHLGIAYHFEHTDGRDVVVFSDHNQAFGAPEGGAPIPFAPRGERVDVHRLEVKSRVVPRHYVQRDYNYRNPGADLTARTEIPGAAAGGVVEYGGHFKDADEGRWLAEIRAQERNAQRRVFEGESDAARLGAGMRFTLSGHPRGDLRLLVTEIRHRARQTVHLEGGGSLGDAGGYANEFSAILETAAYRPPRVTPRPRVSGVLTAIVDAENKGQYAELDDQGRYRVKFMFDTSGPADGKASSLVRMMQPHAGPGYGMHFPLRSGVEVLITFLDGDPDRPIIAGTVPNPQTASPVAMDNATKNILRTGGGNEIAIDDAEDSHRIKMMTPNANTTFQLGAPNDPEKGAMLSTLGASTTVATTGLSAAGAFASTISLITDYSSSGDITTIAKKPGPEALFTLVVNVINALVGAVTTTVTEVEAGMALSEKASSQEATKATEAATAAQKKCKSCRDEALQALPASKQTQIDAMLALCNDCTSASHPSPQAGKACSLSQAQQQSLTAMQAYEAKRNAALNYCSKVDAADALHDSAMEKRYWLNYYVNSSSTQTEDMHDTSAGVLKDNAVRDYQTAYAAYKTAQGEADAARAAATAPYAGGTDFDAYDRKMAECGADDACGEVDSLRDEAQNKNNSFNDLVTAHGPHKDRCKEARTYLGVWATVPPLFSAAMFIYTKLKKTQKAVEAIAVWRASNTALIAAHPRPLAAAAAYSAVPASPQHVLGAENSMHLYGAKDLLASSEKVMIYGIGMQVVSEAQVPDPTKGKVGIVGMEEVRIASPGKVEVAAANKLQQSADQVDILGDVDVKVSAPSHTFTAQVTPRTPTPDLAKLTLNASAANTVGTAELSTAGGQSFKLTQATPATASEIKATAPGDFKVDSGAHVNIEAATEIKLSIKNNGPSITMDANGITLKMGNNAQVLVKGDQVMMKFGSTVVCRLTADKAVLQRGANSVTLSDAGVVTKGPRINNE